MKILKIISTFLINICICISISSDFHIDILDETLENGIRLIVVPMKSNKCVKFGIIYNVGSMDDPIGKIGLSHFLEHMMFKGTKTIPGNKYKYLIDKYNSNTNAFTSEDITCYYYVLQSEFLDINMKLEADRMQNLSLDQDDINSEKQVILKERNMMMESDPKTMYVIETILKSLYLYSNYSYPVIGYKHQIESYDRPSLKKHYNKFYTPSNATILIVGDISKEEALKKTKLYFGFIKSGKKIERKRVVDPKDMGIHHIIDHASKQITTKDIGIVYNIDREKFNNFKNILINKIIITMLSGSNRSYLYKNIVIEKNMAYNLDGSLDIRLYDKILYIINADLTNQTNFMNIRKEIEKYIELFQKKIHDKSKDIIEMFEITKNSIKNLILLDKDDPERMFDMILQYTILNYKTEDIKNIYQILDSITFEDILHNIDGIFNNQVLVVYNHPKSK